MFCRYLYNACKKKRPPKVTFYDYSDEEIPVFRETRIRDLTQGLSFQIAGYLPPNCERFAIHLCLENETRDIALRINPRFPHNCIVRNSRLSLKWGKEEDACVLPFRLQRNSKFTIQIVVGEPYYLISLNRFHFTKYVHRVPYRLVKCIEVYGDVSNVKLSQRYVYGYPERFTHSKVEEIFVKRLYGPPSIPYRLARGDSLQLPYYGLIPNRKLAFGKHVRFEGRVKLLPLSFYINLQAGHFVWPHPIITFHFRCRFAKHRDYLGSNIVSKNAWFNGWLTEECNTMTTDLRPGKVFSLVIVRRQQFYEVFLNKQFITRFQFRMDPNYADTVKVLGDIKLWKVVVEDHDDLVYEYGQKRRSKIEFLQKFF